MTWEFSPGTETCLVEAIPMSGNVKQRKLLALVRKYVDGTASEREKVFVEKYYAYLEQNQPCQEHLTEEQKLSARQRMLEKIHAAIRHENTAPWPQRHKILIRLTAAAALLAVIAWSIFYFQRPHPVPRIQVVTEKNDLEPGTNGAILKMAGGKTIILDTARSGQPMYHAGNVISKTDSAVSITALHPPNTIEYYTLITPRGRQEQLVLGDGTKVWLNAASSIRFPNVFQGSQRMVEVTGEAFFEVAKDVSRPFTVKVNDLEIRVLGTRFNVTAYPEEAAIKTTLLEGAVKIARGDEALLLKPGQQAWVEKDDKIRLVRDAHIQEAVAWKDNLFWFENDDISTVMNRLGRWYDVDILIQGNIPDLFTGSIPRNLPFSKVFEVLQKTGSMHYKLENHQIIVSP